MITEAQFVALHEYSLRTSLGFAELLRRAIDAYLAHLEVTLSREGEFHRGE
jgi:hypothetical protein